MDGAGVDGGPFAEQQERKREQEEEREGGVPHDAKERRRRARRDTSGARRAQEVGDGGWGEERGDEGGHVGGARTWRGTGEGLEIGDAHGSGQGESAGSEEFERADTCGMHSTVV